MDFRGSLTVIFVRVLFVLEVENSGTNALAMRNLAPDALFGGNGGPVFPQLITKQNNHTY